MHSARAARSCGTDCSGVRPSYWREAVEQFLLWDVASRQPSASPSPATPARSTRIPTTPDGPGRAPNDC